MKDKLPIVNLAKHPNPVLTQSPVLSSERSGWNGIFFTHYHHPAHESPEHQWMQHLIGMTSVRHSIESKHRLNNQLQNNYCKPNEILLIPAGVSYAGIWHQAGEFSLLGFYPKFFEQVAYESIQVKQIELIPQLAVIDPFIQQIGFALKADVESGNPAGRLFGESLATALVVHLLKHYSVWQPQLVADESRGLPEYQLKKVLDYIHTHLSQDITLLDIAGVLDLSQYHFCRLFKQSVGIAPHQYITQCRIERAKQLLLESKPLLLAIKSLVSVWICVTTKLHSHEGM
ncbi:MAG: AraC family transcriptional regulator [Brasilonema sp.]